MLKCDSVMMSERVLHVVSSAMFALSMILLAINLPLRDSLHLTRRSEGDAR